MKVTVPERDLFRDMNKTERAYAMILEAKRRAGEIREWRFERVTVKLADDCRYTPDFFVVAGDGACEFHEVKGGFIREDAKIKLKVAAEQFPFRFVLCQLLKTGWEFTEMGG